MSKEEKIPRQHTVSMPKEMYATVAQEGGKRGLSVGEFARSLWRCWIDGLPLPPRHVGMVEPTYIKAPELSGELKSLLPQPITAPPATPSAEVAAAVPALRMRSTPAAPPSPPPLASVRKPDPDFDAPDALAEARRLLSQKHEDVPF